MVSKIEIFNMALGFIGTRAIASENENTPEAAQCRLYWDTARRGALRDFPFPFAVKRVRLQAVELPEEWQDSFSRAYGLPADALKVIRVGDNAPFEIGLGIGGELAIYTDLPDAVAVVVADVPRLEQWDDLFVMAMAYKLALMIAVPLLKNNPQKVQELAGLYQACLSRLEGHAASERRAPKSDIEDWIAARWGWN